MRRAFAFLTPFGGAATPDARTMRWFPVVGSVIGAAVGLVWWAATKAWAGPLVPAALAVAADLVATGMLHFDGLADAADGLLPHLSRDRRLEVMAQPDVGAFGVAVAISVLLLRFAAFSSVAANVGVVAGIWCASRSLMALGPVLLPYARAQHGGGLASAFLSDGTALPALVGVLGVVAGGGLAAWGVGWAGIAGVGAAVVAGGAVFALARARLGGFTGDVLGAAGLLAETVGLVVVAAKW